MIDQDSPLRRLPHGLSVKQIVFLDALRVSAEIAGQAYDDILCELHTLAYKVEPDGTRNFVRIIRDAWTFVDAVHRFRAVLQQAPGIVHNHVYKLFIRRTEAVTQMRNTAQHLNRELPGIAERGQGAYGTLTWVAGEGNDAVPRSVMLNMGAAYGRVVGPIVDFEERLPVGDIRRLRLELAGNRLMLADAQEHLASMVRSIEGSLGEVAEGKPRYGCDQFINFEAVPVDQTLKSGEDT